MEFEMILEAIYHLSGVIVVLFFLFVIIILRKEKPDVIKSRIFLKYDLFRQAFYTLFVGALFFLIGKLIGFYNHTSLYWMHDAAEVIYNLSVVIFIVILYSILRSRTYEAG